MKQVLWLPFVFLAGFIAGAWGPTAKLRTREAEIRDLRRTLEDSEGRADHLGGIVRMLRIAEAAGAAERAAPGAAPGGRETTPAAPGATGRTTRAAGGAASGPGPAPAGRRRALRERIEMAREVWQLRSDIARSEFIAARRMSHQEAAQFDVLIESMNLRLRERIEFWAAQLRDAAMPVPEAATRMVNELSGVLVLTYDELDRVVPREQGRETAEPLRLGDLIDPSVAAPLIDVEGQLRAGRGIAE
jgi:hypothetical protein